MDTLAALGNAESSATDAVPASDTPSNAATFSWPESGAGTARVWDGSLEEAYRQITTLYVKLKRTKSTDSQEHLQSRADSVRAFLFYLEHEFRAAPQLKVNKIDKALKLIKDNPHVLPEDITAKGIELFDRFEAESWGESAEVHVDEAGDDEVPVSAGPAPGPSVRGAGGDAMQGTSSIRLPPPNHPIWGLHGIMHGLALKHGAKDSYIFDPRYINEKRNPKAIGANGLQPGAWWPLQRLALFHGAHGHAIAGISGNPEIGAYSIVVSGKPGGYHDLDDDLGETIFYSADNSIDNTDRDRVVAISGRTRSLQTSLRTGQPVRVLRSSGTRRAYAPLEGIRYDGLYTVVRQRERTNAKGGKYLQFELHRLGGQLSFAEIVKTTPTEQQLADYRQFKARSYY